ncbi:hypothetical protein SPRG_16831 [Saprolegnia parasitica CBS 223.65]|uniref:F-box domain-containing protein n=1 Tax=Saprolegnia parasitica (strain CBS 223.65) TaxID=695850 RepID=A0A067BLH9_SAPPC|nr:hypothetical protein SPRG_16831 [Saprolegnia parasitica CBS 223.65]KDO17585.1 hypothetical protein SPRG_16831 [Saprolegnia parasitica CBS 223.65]|eukprot:XP_012211705.1 hypothetical protein SPRG_16831 [Saprolegnia parasitica CBS 223.65]
MSPTMDHDGAIAFCDALQANTTLQELAIVNVRSLGRFHGRTLPLSLKSFSWDVRFNGAVDAATLTDLATAVGPTQLERLECSVFGQLATCPASASMLSQLQCLSVSWSHADHMPALIAGLSSVPALTSLELRDCNLSSAKELMETLATSCMHLEMMIIERDNYNEEKRAICEALAQVPDVPFVLQTLPEGMDEFVVDALSPRADRRHECALHF